MLIKTQGIILRTVRYSETSIIADIYTEEKGLRAYIISGVRNRNAKMGMGMLQIMSIVELVTYDRDSKTINRIKELKAAYVYQTLPFDVKKAAIGMFMAELVSKTIKETEVNKALFQYLYESFVALDQAQQSIGNWHLLFMLEMATFLGFMPDNNYTRETPWFDLQEGVFVAEKPVDNYLNKEMSLVFSKLLANEDSVVMNRSQRNELLKKMMTYYQLHIESFKELNSWHILQEVLE